MNADITTLDLLPETDPVKLADLDGVGLRPCSGETCSPYTCGGWTCFITEW